MNHPFIMAIRLSQIKYKHILSAIFGILYATSSAGETLAVKSLNYAEKPLILPTYTAFLSNQMWIFMVPLYWQLLKERKETSFISEYILQYTGMGFLTFAITLLRNISVNNMPGSIFSLLISTSILFNMILSWVFLKKRFNYWHIGAAIACIASALCIAMFALFTTEESGAVDANFTLGIPTAIGAAFVVATMTVWQEHLQIQWDDYNFRVVEITFVSSIIASCLVIVYGFIVNDLAKWWPAIQYSTSTESGMILVICVSFALPVLKLIVRNSKYATIQNSSGFFFEFVQSSSSLLGSLANILIFKEPWNAGYLVSFVLLAISFALYAKAKLVEKQKKKSPETTVYTSSDLNVNPIMVVSMPVAWK